MADGSGGGFTVTAFVETGGDDERGFVFVLAGVVSRDEIPILRFGAATSSSTVADRGDDTRVIDFIFFCCSEMSFSTSVSADSIIFLSFPSDELRSYTAFSSALISESSEASLDPSFIMSSICLAVSLSFANEF